MKSRNRFTKHAVWAGICVLALLLPSVSRVAALAQEEETERKLWDTKYIGNSRKTSIAKRAAKRRNYRVVTPQVPAAGVAPDTVLGVTIWRLRPARSKDAGERLIVQESSGSMEWIPERVSSDTQFVEGDRVRLGFEVARKGYLYVIDREQYADGTSGEPYLIFPTMRTRGGNNAVSLGQITEIPAQDDKPPYFKFRRSRADQIGETLTVIVSPTPIEGLQTTDGLQRLEAQQVEMWEKQWGGVTGRLELSNGAGKPWTLAEKAVGADRLRVLGIDEPPPQTIYYRPAIKDSSPVTLNVQLKYRRAQGLRK